MCNPAGDPVYSIADGEVLYSSTSVGGYGPNGTLGGAVVARHRTATGVWFTALYGHLDQPVGVGAIAAGQVIGRSNAYTCGSGPCPHVHFGIRLGFEPAPVDALYRGYTYDYGNSYGYIDPIAFLADNNSPVMSAVQSLIKLGDNPTVYWQQNNRHYPIVSANVLDVMDRSGLPGWGVGGVATVLSLPGVPGPNFINTDAASNGLLLRQIGTNTVYLIENGRRRAFVSEAALNWKSSNWFGDVIDVPMSVFDAFTNGTGNNIHEIAEGESNASIKAAITNKYYQNADDSYCSAATAADPALRAWAERGWPGNFSVCLGFPRNPVFLAAASSVSGLGGRYQNFGNDSTRYGIIVHSDRGTYAVWGAIFERWASLNFQGGCLGFPISDERPSGANRVTDFEGGRITWIAETGQTAVVCGAASTRIVALTGSLAFGSVQVGTSAVRALTISNSGNDTLTISSISYPAGFSGDWAGGAIPAGSARVVTVTFAPVSASNYGGTITVNGNHTAGANTIIVSGTGSACSYALSPPSVNLGNLAAQGTISVATQTGCPWSAVSNSAFLTFVNASNRSGPGTLTFRIQTNSSLSTRGGTGTVAGRIFAVNQSPAPPLRLAPDLDLDGDVDLIWQNRREGYLAAWRMDGVNLVSSDLFSPGRVTDPNWRIAATADMDGDGQLDLVWQEETQGWIGIWKMNALSLVSSLAVSVERVPDTDWKIVAAQDFNADGKADIVWHHRTLGYVALWYMNGVELIDSVLIGLVPDKAWQIEATADFNSDGKPDLLWRHQTQGWVAAWLMDGLVLVESRDLSPNRVADTNWRIVSVADVNRDNMPDLIWQDVVNGWIGVWLMNGTTLLQSTAFSPERVPDTNWRIVGPK